MRTKLKITEGIFPMPVLMVATYNEDGSVNVMNAAWGTMQERDTVALNLTETHKTVQNIKDGGVLVRWSAMMPPTWSKMIILVWSPATVVDNCLAAVRPPAAGSAASCAGHQRALTYRKSASSLSIRTMLPNGKVINVTR